MLGNKKLTTSRNFKTYKKINYLRKTCIDSYKSSIIASMKWSNAGIQTFY